MTLKIDKLRIKTRSNSLRVPLPGSQFIFLLLGLVPGGYWKFTQGSKAVDLFVQLFDLSSNLNQFFRVGGDIIPIPFPSFPAMTNGRTKLWSREWIKNRIFKILDFVRVFLHAELDSFALRTFWLDVVLPEELVFSDLTWSLPRWPASSPFFLASFWI